MGIWYSLYYPAYLLLEMEVITFAYSTEIFRIIKMKAKCKQWQKTVMVLSDLQQCLHGFPFITKGGSKLEGYREGK